MGIEPTMRVGQSAQDQAFGSLRAAMDKQRAAKEAAARESERKQAQANADREYNEGVRQFGLNYALNKNKVGESEWSNPVADTINGGWIVVHKRDPSRFMRINSDASTVAGGNAGMPPPVGANGLIPFNPPAGKPPSEAETKAGMQGGISADAMVGAQNIIAKNPSAATPGWLETAGTLIGMNPEQQQLLAQVGGGPERGIVRGMQEGAIDSALTTMTGQAYTTEQKAGYKARFMPTTFDTPESRKIKATDFMQFIRQQSIAAGRAWTPERENQLQLYAKMIEESPDEETSTGGAAGSVEWERGPDGRPRRKQ